MLRLSLLILIFLACMGAGVYLGSVYSFRLDDLRRFKKGLLMLRSEIDYLSTPLNQALHNIAHKLGRAHPMAQFFEGIAQRLDAQSAPERAVADSLSNYQSRLYLSSEDREAVCAFGKTLGYLDKTLQLEAIAMTLAYVDERIQQEREHSLKYKKMYQTLGVLAGLLVVVLFI